MTWMPGLRRFLPSWAAEHGGPGRPFYLRGLLGPGKRRRVVYGACARSEPTCWRRRCLSRHRRHSSPEEGRCYRNALEFPLGRMFIVQKGSSLTKADMVAGSTPFIGAVELNNGLATRVDGDPEHVENTITVVYNENSVAEPFYQPEDFCCSDDVNVLYPRFEMVPEIGMF